MDEIAMAFAGPEMRAAATAAQPLDRLSVRDYVRPVEIGAFRSERGVAQRVRFNVVLEVAHHAAAEADDVDQVISYDTIVEAIDGALAAARVDLLETLAERIAARCLADPRAVRTFVRIEKLDRIPAALGIEIVRSRGTDDVVRLQSTTSRGGAQTLRPSVVYLGPAALSGPRAADWLAATLAVERPAILCVAPAATQPRAANEPQLQIGLLSIEQTAWALADRDQRIAVTASRTEIDWALRRRRPAVWAPARMVSSALPRPKVDASEPAALAAWLAAELQAEILAVAEAKLPETPPDLRVLSLAAPEELAELP